MILVILNSTLITPWYQSLWFVLLLLLAAIAMGGLAVYYRERYRVVKRQYAALTAEAPQAPMPPPESVVAVKEPADRKLPDVVKSNNDALMERVLKCVNNNISNPDFNVDMLTSEVGISRSQLHRKMKELTGGSTSEYIRNLRLEYAARLIQERKFNVTQVAYSVGFNNQAHFSTVFKKHYGMTPTEYSERPIQQS